MRKTCLWSVMRALALMVGVAAPLASPGAVPYPKTSIPNVRSAVIECDVTTDRLTSNCGYRSFKNWSPTPDDLAVAKDLDAHPARLAEATPGARVEVIVRRSPWTQADPPLDWAPPPPAGATLVVDPTWRLLPPPDILKEFYPERALRMGMKGEATATCTVGPAGDLVACWTVSEAPTNQGFAVALLKITTCVQIDPVTKSGQSAPGRTIKVGAHFTVSRWGPFAVQLVLLTA